VETAVDNFTQMVKSNNNIYNSSVSGTITSIVQAKKSTTISILMANGKLLLKSAAGPDLLVREGQTVQADQPLTNNPNVGGFGQAETEIVLQNPRVQGLIVFLGTIFLTQIFLVLKRNKLKSSII
jgi:apocytochrome f